MIIELNNFNDALNPYNKELLNDELNEYIKKECLNNKKKIEINIIGNLTHEEKNKLENIIHNFYYNSYTLSNKIDKLDNYIRIISLLFGSILILISEEFISFFSELFLIAGWILIWEMLYDILFNEIKRKKILKIYKTLATCNITFK